MATSSPLCSICDLRHTSEPAVVWCTDCDEGFCTVCSEHHSVSKLSRHHTTKTIEDYQKLPPYILEIEQFCKEHQERFLAFCKEHDTPCCRTCVLQNHKQCPDVSKIEDVVHGVKNSNAFQELDQILTELAENIRKIKKDRKENLKSLEKSKIRVEEEIKEFRERVNDHLDKLQAEIKKELNTAEESEKKKIQIIVDELRQNEKNINEIKTNFSNIKQHASDLQAYFAMKQIQDDADKTDTVVNSLMNSDKVQQTHLSLEIHTAIKDILSSVKSFGKIVVETKGSEVVIVKKKNQQAQLLVPQQIKPIDDITLQLQQTINVNSSSITGCCILPDGKLVFTNYWSRTLIFLNYDGTEDTTITLPSYVFDVTYVKHNNLLAVTSGSDNALTFVNIKTRKVEETVKLQSYSYEITEKDNTLYFCSRNCIYAMNLNDKTITKFKDIQSGIYGLSYIEVFENNLYHTNCNTNTVTCYDLSGEVKWEFKDESLIQMPFGISVDNQGNVFVAGELNSNVVVISPDGQKCRELLSTNDKLSSPCAIHYDRSTDRLLVANLQNTAFLYETT